MRPCEPTATCSGVMTESSASNEGLVPDSVIPHGDLPPLSYRNLPEPVPLRKMIGPGLILAGLALGSGEFVLWPFIVSKIGFVFFWACVVGVITQYFLNMEISRWTLATGESAITGFCRINRHFAWVFLAMNIIPWIGPAWARGSAEVLSWLIWDPVAGGAGHEDAVCYLSIAGFVLCGAILTGGPVVYETVEKVQIVLVTCIVVLILVLAVLVVRWDAVVALMNGALSFGRMPPENKELSTVLLLGALAFAGAGGTTNLGQSNYIKDKGYGMGQYIGRITSPITGQEEAVVEVGYHFPDTPENRRRWKQWWWAAGGEHFLTFFVTCIFCLVMLTLICYSTFYTPDGEPRAELAQFDKHDMTFILGEANVIGQLVGPTTRTLFLVMGLIVLLTTNFGVLDVISRISTDIVKVNWLRDNTHWTESRLYYAFLWGTILIGTVILLARQDAMVLFKAAASLNGVVMFLYSMTLLYLNWFCLPKYLRFGWFRGLVLVWSICFFGYFTVLAGGSLLADFTKKQEKQSSATTLTAPFVQDSTGS